MIDKQSIGTDLAWLGAGISCAGVYANNIMLDHVLAMNIWRMSNIVLLGWSAGLWRKWWDGGLAGLALVVMYGWYVISNEWGLMHI